MFHLIIIILSEEYLSKMMILMMNTIILLLNHGLYNNLFDNVYNKELVIYLEIIGDNRMDQMILIIIFQVQEEII